MKKKLLIITLIVAAIAVAVGVYLFITLNDNSYEIEEVTSFNYLKLYDNQKYGVIDAKGNILIEAKYDNIEIPNPSKPVFIAYTGENMQVLNEKNEKILTQFQKVLPIQLKETNSNVPFEKSVLAYVENGKFGIINYSGKKLTNANYDSIESLLYKEGCLLVKVNEKYGILNIRGKEIIKPEYDSITADGYYDENTKYKDAGFVIGQKKDEGYRYGYINSNAEKLLDTEFSEINRITEMTNQDVYILATKNGKVGLYKNKEQILSHFYEEIEFNKVNELFIIKKNNKQGVLDKNAKSILKADYDNIMISGNKINAQKEGVVYLFDIEGNKQEFNDQTIISTENENYFITINNQNLFGIIDKNNKILVDNEYQYIEYAFDNNFIASKDGKVGVIGVDKNTKINFDYDVIQKVKNTKILQAIKSEGNISEIYNSKFQNVLWLTDALIVSENGYVKISSENQRKFLDTNGNILDNKDVFPNANLLAYQKDNKWGFVDRNGNVKVDTIYDMVTEQNSFGYAGIKKDGKWGVVDASGKVVLEPTYEIEWDEPEFIGKYIKLNFGYGFYYYTTELGK